MLYVYSFRSQFSVVGGILFTESLADGPDWHLRSRFCSGLSLFSAVDEDACGLAKTFPDIPCVPQMHGGPSLRRGDTKEGLNNPSGIGCDGKDTDW